MQNYVFLYLNIKKKLDMYKNNNRIISFFLEIEADNCYLNLD
jgi:hypothetical protein